MSVASGTSEDVEYRIEHDTMGEVRVPINALWRAQTQRAVENFPISGRGLERTQIRAPVSRIDCTNLSCLGRSSTHTVTSATSIERAFATRRTFSPIGAVMSIASADSGPTASFSM